MKDHFNNDWLDSLNYLLYYAKFMEDDDLLLELNTLQLKYFSHSLKLEDWERLYEIEEEKLNKD